MFSPRHYGFVSWLLPLWAAVVGCSTGSSGLGTSGQGDTQPVVYVDTSVDFTPVTCSNPAEREKQRFDSLVFEASNPTWKWIYGQGFAVLDLDLDGDLEIVLPTEGRVYVNDGRGGFVEDTERLPEFEHREWISALSGADYDGDGDFDLYVSVYGKRDRFWQNNGDGYFVDVTDEVGLSDDEYMTQGTSWADFDRDGDLDVFVANYGYVADELAEDFGLAEPNLFYVNNGDGTLSEASDLLPEVSRYGYTFQGTWFDFEGDGDQDLYVVNDFGVVLPNMVLKNEGDHFVIAPNQRGLDLATFSMGLAVADYNGDGLEDFYVSSWKTGFTLVSRAGQWLDCSQLLFVEATIELPERVGWGAWFSDFDVDGDLDLYVLYGFLETFWPNPFSQLDSLYVQKKEKVVADENIEWGLGSVDSRRSLIVADLNRDGWPDPSFTAVIGDHGAYVSRCGSEAWLRINLEQAGLNRYAIGARIRVGTADNVWTEWIRAGGVGFGAGGPPEVLFGLADHDEVAFIEITWPDGAVSILERVATRQALVVRRME